MNLFDSQHGYIVMDRILNALERIADALEKIATAEK